MRMPKWRTAWMLIVTVMGWCVGVAPCHAGEVITNETIRRASGAAHGVMKEQRQRIRDLLDGFLVGDLRAIRAQAETIANAMSRVEREFPPGEGQEAAQWRRLVNVIEQAHVVSTTARDGNYQQAYLYFSAMIGQCIECHQGRRPWGVFPAREEPRKE